MLGDYDRKTGSSSLEQSVPTSMNKHVNSTVQAVRFYLCTASETRQKYRLFKIVC